MSLPLNQINRSFRSFGSSYCLLQECWWCSLFWTAIPILYSSLAPCHTLLIPSGSSWNLLPHPRCVPSSLHPTHLSYQTGVRVSGLTFTLQFHLSAYLVSIALICYKLSFKYTHHQHPTRKTNLEMSTQKMSGWIPCFVSIACFTELNLEPLFHFILIFCFRKVL